jgi:hypothetical protein
VTVRERDRWVASRGSYPFKFFFSLKKYNLKEMARWRAGIVPRCGPGQLGTCTYIHVPNGRRVILLHVSNCNFVFNFFEM